MDNFTKAFKWYIVTFFIVIGFASLVMADATNSYKWSAPVILSFLMAYVFWYFWCKDFQKKLGIVNALTLITGGIISYHYVDQLVYIIMGTSYDLPTSVCWFIWNAVIGMPVMMITLKLT
jgi:hypothetical protein